MSLGTKKELELKEKARYLRTEIIKMLYHAKSGHAGGSLSAVEILLVLYYNQMRIDPDHPDWEGRDRFIASKGHCVPALYVVLADKGFFAKKELESLRQLGSMLQGHPDMKKTPGIDMSTGSLGLGLSAGIGMGLAARLDNRDYFTFVLLGDGEINEGQIWEASMAAAKFKTDNVITIIDNNGVQLDGRTDAIMPLGDICRKFEAFGWNAIMADGHDLRALDDAIDKAKSVKGMPSVIVAKTVKGKGVSFMEGKHEWHGKVIGDKEFEAAMSQLEGCIAL
jgi:transketolase